MSASCKPGSSCSLTRAMDGRIVRRGVISSCQSAATSAIFRFQGRSRSSMLVPTERLSAVLVMIRSKSESIRNRSQARLVCGIAEIGRFETEPGVSISPGLESVPGRDRQTDRRTDGRTELR